jgi:hypothetical protein
MLFRVMMVLMFVPMLSGVHIELRSGDAAALLLRNVKVIAVQLQLFESVLKFVAIDAEVEHRADEHVTADAAENI